ncbi:MAG: hypothetical protein HC854_00030 [Flavobacterium sp.]|nr:hypothetical protein [Flavobacterium sp.]
MKFSKRLHPNQDGVFFLTLLNISIPYFCEETKIQLMKKTVILLLAITTFVACKKEETQTKELDMSVIYPETKKLIQPILILE